ncbi:MAG: patatin-like phospholipase family protein [Gemmataceae bacterium]
MNSDRVKYTMFLRSRPLLCILTVAIGLSGGCKTTPTPGNEPPAKMTQQKWSDEKLIGAEYVSAERQATKTLNAALCTGPYKPNPNVAPVHILSLSAGGKYAAYMGGALVGWTEQGTRPRFDVVTGMSGGALVAPYAILGSKYDDSIRRHFTTLDGKDFFKYSPFYLITQKTLGSSDPLKKLLAREIHDGVIADLAVAFSEGRRCLIGTMNLHTRRLCVWDITAIAASDRCDKGDLIRKILLAASSIPGFVKSVEFDVTVDGVRYVEQHCDGGAVCQGFYRLTADQAPDGRLPCPPGSSLYCMAAGKLYVDPLVGELGFVSKVRSATTATLYSLYRGDLYRMYTVAVAAGLKFHLCSIPQDFEIAPESMKIDAKDLKRLYNLGYCEGRNGMNWRYQPPGSEPGEEDLPRTGTDFRVDNTVNDKSVPPAPAEPPRRLPDGPMNRISTMFHTSIMQSTVAK